MGKRLGLKQCPIFLEPGDFLITSPFGPRIHPISGKESFHSGVDGVRIENEIAEKATITAIDEGVVIDYDKSVKGYSKIKTKGNYVKIRHASGRVTLYLHLEYGSIPDRIKTGAEVWQGEIIGKMGSTGSSTGCHIHFQVYDTDGKIIEPVQFLIGRNINAKEIIDMYITVTECKYPDRGDAVVNLQAKIAQLSPQFEAEIKEHSMTEDGKFDGVFGKGLQATVTELQELAGIPATGACDQALCELLNKNVVELQRRANAATEILST